jgi:hypothetical protein
LLLLWSFMWIVMRNQWELLLVLMLTLLSYHASAAAATAAAATAASAAAAAAAAAAADAPAAAHPVHTWEPLAPAKLMDMGWQAGTVRQRGRN